MLINFASGLQGTIDLTQALPDLKNNIDLEGPGAKNLTVQRDSSAPDFSVFTVDTGATVNLSGLTISGGNHIGGLAADVGGGIDNLGTLTVSNSVFSSNTASDGGGLFNSGTLMVTDSTFTNNSATYDGGGGGGIWNQGTATVNNSTFTDNIAPNGSGGGIAGVGTLTVNDSNFTNNTAAVEGGGICDTAIVTVTDSTFTNNTAAVCGGGIFGAGFFAVTVTDSTFVDNSSLFGGGIYHAGSVAGNTIGILLASDSTFTGNSATWGGGISNYGGTLTVNNSTFADNSAVYGGDIDNDNGGTTTVTNCTIDGNAGQDGGICNATTSTLTLDNTIVAGNSGPDIVGSVQPTSKNNLIGDGTGITNLTELDPSNLVGTTADPLNPMLGPLANNGGPTQTMALLPGSPAIDAGSVALAVDANGISLTTDQRGPGFPRIIGGTVDIGSYESPYTTKTQSISFPPIPTHTYGVAPITLTATASSNLPVSYTVILGPATISGNVLTITGAGLVDVEADQAGNATYAVATPVDESFTVTSAPLTVTATNESMVYGGTVPTPLTYTYTGLVNNDPSATFSGSLATTATSSSNVGDYAITEGNLAATGNYTIGTFNPGTLTVNAAPLTVNATGESMTYGGTVPALTYTYTGLVNGDSSATFNGGLATTATSRSSVGGYPITVGTLVATGNYTIGTFNPGTLTVNAAPLTITANNDSKTYGTLKTFSSTALAESGLVNGDTINGVTETSTGAPASATIGTYNIVPSAATGTGLSNYTIGYVNGTLTVNPATLTITANNDSKTYGTLKTFSSTAFAETGLVNGDTITGVTETSAGAAASAPVGTYNIVPSAATGTGLSNYTITYINGTLTVNAAALTITANNDSKTYGTLKTFSGTAFTASGLVNGDTITGVTETSTGAPASAAVGIYNIVPSAATGTGLGNYTIGYANGTLTVNAAPLTITANNDSKTYGTLKTFSGTAFTETGLVTVNGDTITGVTETSTGAGSSTTLGTYQHRSQRHHGHRSEQLHHRLRQRHADRQRGTVDHHGQQ